MFLYIVRKWSNVLICNGTIQLYRRQSTNRRSDDGIWRFLVQDLHNGKIRSESCTSSIRCAMVIMATLSGWSCRKLLSLLSSKLLGVFVEAVRRFYWVSDGKLQLGSVIVERRLGREGFCDLIHSIRTARVNYAWSFGLHFKLARFM